MLNDNNIFVYSLVASIPTRGNHSGNKKKRDAEFHHVTRNITLDRIFLYSTII